MSNENKNQDTLTGAFTDKEEKLLEKVEDFLDEALIEIRESNDKITKNEDVMNLALAISKQLTDGIHKKSTARSRTKEVNTNADTAESNMEFIKSIRDDIRKGSATTKSGPIDFPDSQLPTAVPGQMEIGISKPTLKEIMDTPIIDDDDEE